MKYVVTIAGRRVEVEVDGDRILVDGVVHRAELSTTPGTPIHNLLLDGSSWIIPMESTGRGKWLLQRRGEHFEAEVLDERTDHIRSLVGEGRSQAGPATLKAPMPGLVVRILVEAGQPVAAGQGLVVLEAMKMENELKAISAGVVDRIPVAAGQPVEKGAVLVLFQG